MASETLSFDIVGRDAGASTAFRRVGDTATLAARGARTCAIALEQQRKAADTSAGATLALAKADRILADAEDELSGKTAKARREMERAAASAGKASGGGAGGRAGFAGKIAGGAGPGILGISGKLAAITAGGGALAATIPALGAIGGAVTAVGAGIGLLVSKGGPLHKQAVGLMKDVTSVFRQAAGPLIGPLRDAFKQFGGFLKQISPLLKQVFAAVAPFIKPLLGGLEAAVKGVLPGFVALLKAAAPAVRVLGQVLGTIGKNLGAVFTSFAPVIKASSVVLKALSDVLAGLLPVVGKIVAAFATAFAPVVTTLAAAFRALAPILTLIGKIIAQFAVAAFKDLGAVLTAVVTLIKGIAPSLGILAKTLGTVFQTLENTGVFAILASALEALAKPLANLINALVKGLAPVLPPIINLISDVSGQLVRVLVAALKAVIPVAITLIKDIFIPLNPLIRALVPLIGLIAKGLGALLVGAIRLVTPLLNVVVKVIGWIAQGLAAVIKWIVSVGKNWTTIWHGIVGVAKWFADRILGFFGLILHGAADAFGWIPGIGPKLKDAAAAFDRFHARVDAALSFRDKTVTVGVSFVSPAGGRKPLAAGGIIAGGIPGRDSVPGLLMPGEVVVPAQMVRAGAVDHLRGRLPGFAAGGLVGGVSVRPSFPSVPAMAAAALAIVRHLAQRNAAALFGGIPGSVSSYSGVVLQVLRMLGQPAIDLGVVLRQMQTESGGNPWAVNKWDSNWAAGHPSVGLMQVIGPTFGAYAGPFRRTGPFEYGVSVNPPANIFAGLNYAIHRYGAAWTRVLGQGHGYDHGGWLRPGLTLAYNGTGRPERVLGPGEGPHVIIRMGGRGGRNSLDALLMQWIRHNVRVEGGGDVQIAFGGG